MKTREIKQLLLSVSEKCSVEIENYSIHELKKWDRLKTLEYFMEFIEFEIENLSMELWNNKMKKLRKTNN